MRGADEQTGALFSYLSLDALVPKDRPLRAIRGLVNRALEQLSPKFETLYASGGRASIAPEKLLRAPVASVLRRAFGAAADGAGQLQRAVPLVRRPTNGRAGQWTRRSGM
jgi:hypothetical protein